MIICSNLSFEYSFNDNRNRNRQKKNPKNQKIIKSLKLEPNT